MRRRTLLLSITTAGIAGAGVFGWVSIRRGFSDLLASSETGAQRKKIISTRFHSAGSGHPMRSPRPWSFSRRTTAATSLERNCLWMAALHKCRPVNRRGRCCPIPMEKAMTTTAYAAADSHCVRPYGLTQHQIKSRFQVTQ
jgi:hypothetical protein